jgi:hypothetical protein
MSRITQQRLRELFLYEPSTGQFIRIRRTSNSTKCGEIAGYRHVRGYIYMSADGRSEKAHRLAWLYQTGEWPKLEIDHIDGNPSNNAWSNLRLATHAQNNANCRPRAGRPPGLKGIRPFRNRFQVRLGSGGRVHVGTFDTLSEAQEAYKSAAIAEFGEFARIP